MSASPFFTEAHHTFRSEVRSFFHETIAPHLANWELQKRIPRYAWKALGAAGFLGLNYPDRVGATNDIFRSIIFLEELGRLGYAGFRGAVSVHTFMATDYLARYGSEKMKQLYLDPAIRGETVTALAITEIGTGSDLNRVATVADRFEGSLRINGTKAYITNGTSSDVLITVIREAGIASTRGREPLSVVAIDAKLPGIIRTPIDCIGWHCADVARVDFENVVVPEDHVLGRPGYGFFYLMQSLQLERLAAATLALGGAMHCLEITRDRAYQRAVFGQRLGQRQVVRHRLADAYVEIMATRALIYETAYAFENGEIPVTACSAAKLKATDLAVRIAQECLQLHGAFGYSDDAAVSRVYRDAPVGTVAGGSSETMRELIADDLLREAPTE